MFPALIPTLKWYEWVLIGALCLFAIATYVLGNQYLELRDQHASLTTQSKAKDTTITKQKAIAELTDRIVADAIAAQTENESVLVVTRRGVIDEYLTPVVQESVPTPVPVESPPPVQAVEPDKPVEPARVVTVRPPPPSSGASVRINRLAERMHERYCATVGPDAYCPNPPSPTL